MYNTYVRPKSARFREPNQATRITARRSIECLRPRALAYHGARLARASNATLDRRYHFGSKEALLNEAIIAFAAMTARLAKRRGSTDASPWSRWQHRGCAARQSGGDATVLLGSSRQSPVAGRRSCGDRCRAHRRVRLAITEMVTQPGACRKELGAISQGGRVLPACRCDGLALAVVARPRGTLRGGSGIARRGARAALRAQEFPETP